MRWAIAVSIVFHMAAFSLVFRTPRGDMRAYPRSINVDLISSPPPLKGVKNAAAQQTVTPEQKKVQKKVEKPPEDTRMAELNAKKKPRREQTKPQPEPQKEEPQRNEQPEPQNEGLPDGVELGSEFGSARLDAAGFDSPTFLNILFGKIRREWDNPFEGDESISCTIFFQIDRGGRITDSAIEAPSGIEAYDQAALRAVLSTKSPPLPNQFELDQLGIHLVFRYNPNL
jgi:TonB family protein